MSLLPSLILALMMLCGWNAGRLRAQPPSTAILPVHEIQAGQRGVGRTVFAGTRVESFDVEILGVLEAVGPRQNVILARLSGGPLAQTGVLQGMSGSPVWIGGKLVGAVAFAFPFSKEPIAGIRPIEEMFAEPVSGPPAARRPDGPPMWRGDGRQLVEVATPIFFSGMTARAIEHFAGTWRQYGLEPLQGVSGRSAAPGFRSGPLEPGSMISVQLMTGDMAVGADGTVTHREGDRIWGFGHRFLSAGSTDLPFAQSEVVAVLPSLASSFKISAAREWLGAITSDGNAAIVGVLGRRPPMTPLEIRVEGRPRQHRYRMELIRHPALTPFLLQMALFSAIDATERTLGTATVLVEGEVQLEGNLPPLKVEQAVTSDWNAPALASLASAAPLVSLLQAASDPVQVAAAAFRVRVVEDREHWQIDQLTVSRREVRPGDEIGLALILAGANGQERVEQIRYRVPDGLLPGTLQITASDAMTTNLAANRTLLQTSSKPVRQLIRELNELRSASSAYVRISRADAIPSAAGVEFRRPPAGLALLLSRQATVPLAANVGAALREIAVPLGLAVVSGSRTTQIEVKP